MLTAKDIQEFNAYLRDCTNNQVRGVFDHETARGGDGALYAELARAAAEARGIDLG